MTLQKIALLGAGSWGTAVAIHLAKQGHSVMLWGQTLSHVEDMIRIRKNNRYLPDIAFPDSLHPTHNLEECLNTADRVIIAVPSHAFATLLSSMTQPKHGIAWLTKGLDPGSHRLLSQLVAERFGENYPMAMITGPSFAKEVARGLPTALTSAGPPSPYLTHLRTIFHAHSMRVYLSNDIIGVQICGAVKNILAIACGMSDGLGFGANAKAALITRGLAEMKRLGQAFGAQDTTFNGLAGLGDLVLTCTDNQSRNRRFGLYLGEGYSLEEAEEKIGQVIEGRHNAAEVYAISQKRGVDMPICKEVNAVLSGQIEPKVAGEHLMNRPPKDEC